MIFTLYNIIKKINGEMRMHQKFFKARSSGKMI